MYVFVLAVSLFACKSQIDEKWDNVDTQLYLGEGDKQPLIIAFGGGDGGNSWTSSRVKDKRDKLIDKGYAFLAVGYFNTENTPKVLDRISLNTIHDAMVKAAKNPRIDNKRIAVLGVSKGAELALLLASHFSDISCVVAMVPAHCVFPANTLSASTSSWSIDGIEVPFVPMTMETIPALLTHDLHTAFSMALEDHATVEKAAIPVEGINASILFLSAKKDEQWPSYEMSLSMMEQLNQNKFNHTFEHVAIDGGHFEVFDHFDSIYQFLDRNFPVE